MKNISLRMKVLSGMLCAGLTFSGTNISFAAANKENNLAVKPVTSINFKDSMDKKKIEESAQAEMKGTFELVIKESVEANIITRDEGEKVLKYLAEKSDKKCESGKKCKKEKGGLFNALVTEGILTKEKAGMLHEKMYIKKAEIRKEELQKGLTTLVDNKVITIEQKNKVEEVIMAVETQRKEEYKKMKDMTKEEREKHMKKMKDTKINSMKVLVDNGTITKKQEKEIQKVLHKNHQHKHK
ncbi:hypothetical protein LGK97_09390 [Clostridium sp. CS001]|uniref:hypothetical protein n=1 Tax=Clostridium sp. CS001 TaxID=2880648 RepID=UPI001CF597A9|nr:hypothetical protein [Clostridium sp. CS001]MCB2289979.1 hypothetical protein [Clostridium sp. CS001]